MIKLDAIVKMVYVLRLLGAQQQQRQRLAEVWTQCWKVGFLLLFFSKILETYCTGLPPP